MTSRCFTVAFQGLEAIPIDVQVHIAPGLPVFQIVGLGDKAVSESRERIRAAFHSMNLSLPPQRVTVNLAPADIPKEGSHFDLPIALGVLAAMHLIDAAILSDYVALGELGLDGRIQSVYGVLPSSMTAHAHGRGLICPKDCVNEAYWSGLSSIVGGGTLLDIMHMLKHGQQSIVVSPTTQHEEEGPSRGDFCDVRGQASAKRALEIAAAGGHNLLMSGPPGAGKSMLAARFPSILPKLTAQQALEVTMIHSLAGLVPPQGLVTIPPYRDPHHSATLAALVGGGMKCKPGELSLAHHGVLFLDELPEFSKLTLEAMRQPLESGYVALSRANNSVQYPAKTQVIGAMNPCRCGYVSHPQRRCSKAPVCAEHYQQRLSGPLLDRFDLRIYMEDTPIADLMGDASGRRDETSAQIAHRVAQARTVQYARCHRLLGQDVGCLNAHAGVEYLQVMTPLSKACEDLMLQACETLHITGRGYHRIIKVARTIADLAGEDVISPTHLCEAMHYKIG